IKEAPLLCGVATAFFWPGVVDKAQPPEAVTKQRRQLHEIGYGMCGGTVLGDAVSLRTHLKEIDFIQPVLYEQKKVLQWVMSDFHVVRNRLSPEWSQKVKSPLPGVSHELAPLQAADLLAYETRKEVINRCEKRNPRISLERLLADHRPPHLGRCLEMPWLPVY